MRRVSSNAQSSAGREKHSHFSVLFVCFIFLSSAAGAVAESLSLSLGGVRMDFVWVPVQGSDGFKQVEIGDFGGGRAKERKRSESIYAPFERNGQRGYYLGKTEVSHEQWAAVMGEGVRTKLPVVGKTYAEVQLFLDKINSLVRESGEVPSTPDGAQGVVKLPTEAEWEYAARGGECSGYAESDPYGGDLERYEVFSLPGSDGKTKEVGSLPPNRLGLHDMLGNVRELMEGNYSVAGFAGGGLLLKGGSYLSERAELRSSQRTEHQRMGKDGKPSRRPDAGLRLCMSAELVTALGSDFIGGPEAATQAPEPINARMQNDPGDRSSGSSLAPKNGPETAQLQETDEIVVRGLSLATNPPASPNDLPTSGFFGLSELFAMGPYSGFNSYSRSIILRKVQAVLSEQGFYAGQKDGVVGPATQNAILLFQAASSLEPTGRLGLATLLQLGIASENELSSPQPTPKVAARTTLGHQKETPKNRATAKTNADKGNGAYEQRLEELKSQRAKLVETINSLNKPR